VRKMDGDTKLLACGTCGSVIVAICCFTPLLVVAFGLVGLSSWLGWIDYVLFPMLAVFLAVTTYALYRRSRTRRIARREPAGV